MVWRLEANSWDWDSSPLHRSSWSSATTGTLRFSGAGVHTERTSAGAFQTPGEFLAIASGARGEAERGGRRAGRS